MTDRGWRDLVLQAVSASERGDGRALEMVVRMLADQDQAKQALRDLGIGAIGMPWPLVVEQLQLRLKERDR